MLEAAASLRIGRQAEAQTLRQVVGDLLSKNLLHLLLAHHVDPQVPAAAVRGREKRRRRSEGVRRECGVLRVPLREDLDVADGAEGAADDFEFSGEGAQNDLECGKNKDCRYAYRWNAHVHVAADRACRLLGDHARSANRTWPRPVLTLPQLWGSGYWHNPDGEEAAG